MQAVQQLYHNPRPTYYSPHQRDPFFIMFAGASVGITGGTIYNATNMNVIQSKRGIDLLMEFVATDAMHDSDELYDAPKCHPHTRVAVLDEIMNWIIECQADSKAQDEFIMWLFGAAGAGKSAIAKKIAELAAEKGLLIGSFFFSRTSSTRNDKSRLIPTLAHQLSVSIPGTRSYIEEAIERDRTILQKNIQAQIDILLIKPFQSATMEINPFPKLLVIDGLDECSDSKDQVAILDAISRSFTKYKLPIICLLVSRPEPEIVSSFNGKEPLKSIHRRLALDDTYDTDADICQFFSDKFEEMRRTHPLRSTIPVHWPTEESLDALINKSSGQFIFAATVIRFVESNRHRPDARLKIILEISLPGTINPFAELDMLYKQVLSSVDDIQLTLRVLSLYISSPNLASSLRYYKLSEHFLLLEEGDINLALIGLASIVLYDEEFRVVEILHASFVDFLSDKHRSEEFYIDMANARADFACRALQFVKGPDGILAGDISVFNGFPQDGLIPNDQLRNEVLDFDLDAFITAAITNPCSESFNIVIDTFSIWISFISKMGLGDDDEQLLIHRYRDSYESRIQKYQSDWRLQLLLTLAVSMKTRRLYLTPRHLDILLEMDDNNLHLLDKDALDLRSSGYHTVFPAELSDITSRYVDGDRYASAALHCMRFLSNPPQYSDTDSNVRRDKVISYHDWMRTCDMALNMPCELLERANPSSEVIQFISDHDINTTVHKNLPLIDIWHLDTLILVFLSRGGACVNWRIVSAIRRKRATDKWMKQCCIPMSESYDISERYESSEETDSDMYETADDGSDTLSVPGHRKINVPMPCLPCVTCHGNGSD